MYNEFEKNLSGILKAAGYEKIDMPAYEPWGHGFCFWGKISGAMAYYYAVYEAQLGAMAGFAELKGLVDERVAAVSARYNIRNTVIFNIFAGNLSGDVREIEKMIDGQGDFTMMEKYDVYYGVDIPRMRILRNTQQPHNMDGALAKIEMALKGPRERGRSKSIVNWKATPGFAQPVAKYPILCYIILAINAAVFLAMELSGGSESIANLITFGAVAQPLVIDHGEYWRLVTSNFIHIGFMHMLFNTAFLIIFATRAERYFGHMKFGIIYLVSGIFSGVASMLVNPMSISAGASGSLFGVLGGLLAFMLLRKQQIENFNVRSLLMLVGVNVLIGFTVNQMPGGTTIGNAAHIGGLIAGLGLGYILTGKKNKGGASA